MPSRVRLLVAILTGLFAMPAFASDLVLLHAAGSLRGALTEVAESFENAFAVAADYGLTVMADASSGGYQFAMFILSSEGQRILAAHGFSAPNLAQQ